MKQSGLTIFFAALMTALFSACSDDFGSKDIPQEELYTRAFIKEFGVFDMAHTWNLATEGTITVTPTSYINECKVYARYEGEYYYVARAINAYKEFTLTFDIPSGVTDLKLLIDGTTYYAQVGTRLQASGRGSRSAAKESDDVVKYVGLTDWELYPDDYALSYRNTLPENYDNRFKDGITQDFLFTSNLKADGTPVETTLYPVYWQTNHQHTIGIYYYPDNDTSKPMKKVELYKSKTNQDGDIEKGYYTKSTTIEVKSNESWIQTLLESSSVTFTSKIEAGEETENSDDLSLSNDDLKKIINYIKRNKSVTENSTEYSIEAVKFSKVSKSSDGTYDTITFTCYYDRESISWTTANYGASSADPLDSNSGAPRFTVLKV